MASSPAQEPQTTIDASIDFDWISLNSFTPGSTVALNIGGVARSATVDDGGNAFVQRQAHGQDITVGMTITANDGIKPAKALTVANLRIGAVDVALDTVSGTAPSGTPVHVSINQYPGPQLGQADTNADLFGNWNVSFAGIADLQLGVGMGVSANTGDAEGDNTFADMNLTLPWVGASIDYNWVTLNGWTPGSTVALNIGGFATSATVDAGGNAFIQSQVHGQDITVGMTVTASQGGTTKAVTLVNLRIVSVDVNLDTVSGTSPAGASVHVGVNQNGSPRGQTDTTADAFGNWSVSFAGSVDLRLGVGMAVGANTPDADGDHTFADKGLSQPAINGSLTFDTVNSTAFAPGSSVTFTIRSAGGSVLANGTKPTDPNGNAQFNRGQDHQVDLVPGMTVTATDGPTTKGLTLVALMIVSINPATDVVSGTAPAGAQVQVNVNIPPSGGGAGMQVTAGAGGNWSADFTGTFDVTAGTGANASVSDNDGDATGVSKPPATITASLTFDNVNTNGFAANGSVTFTILSAPGGTVLASGAKPTDANGNAQFNRYQDHSVDLVPGLHITVGDGTITKGLTLDPVTIVSIDPATDVVSGTAPADAKVQVNVNNPYPGGPGGAGTQVTADAGGAWSADFSGFGDVTAASSVNVSVQDQDQDSTGFDKQSSTINASVPYDMVGANGFRPGGSITFTIRAPGGGVLATGTKPADSGGRASFNRYQGDHDVDLVPGMQIAAADGLTTKELTLTAIAIVSVDPATDVVAGTAPPGAGVDVGVYDETGNGPNKNVTASAGGDWSADFTGLFDITAVTGARAFVHDEDWDSTGTDKRASTINASLSYDNVGANGFAINDQVDFTIRETPGGPVLASGSCPTDGQGNAWFNRWDQHEVDLVPGMEITATDGTTTKQLTLVMLTIVSVDPATDVVSGTAPPGAVVQVGVKDQEGGGSGTQATADAGGDWSADFSDSFDITFNSYADARVADADGDTTGFDRSPARIDASLSEDHVSVEGFAPYANVNLTIRESPGGAIVGSAARESDGAGNAWFERWDDYDVDLVPGLHLTLTDGTVTKELTLVPLVVTSVNPVTDVVAGTAAPGAKVEVNLDDGAAFATTTADGSGHWAIDFSPYDVTYFTGANARVRDGEGDATVFDMAAARIDVSLTGDAISAEGFAPGATVTYTVRQSPGGATVATGSRQADAGGNAWFNRYDDFDADLAAGMHVSVTDGSTTKQVTLAALAIDSVNTATDVISGSASASSEVEVYVGNDTGEAFQTTTADPVGHWAIDFSPFDVTYSTGAQARVRDAEGDATSADRQPPHVSVDVTYDSMWGDGFDPGSTVIFTIRQTLGGAVLATGSNQADEYGNVWFGRPGDFAVDVKAGMHVAFTQGGHTKDVTVAALSIGAIDAAADTASGTAPPNRPVIIGVGRGEYGWGMEVMSDATGAWSADFDELDITAGTEISAQVSDPEWDWTIVDRQAAIIHGDLSRDTVSGCGFAPEDSVTVHVADFTGSFPTDAAGCFSVARSQHGKNLVPGTVLSVGDGVLSRTLTLGALTMNVDFATGVVSGTAPPGAQVEVGYRVVDEERGDGRTVTADGSGHWTADFSDGLEPNVEVTVTVADGDGDRTELTWLADLRFSAGAYTVSEGAGTIQITVQRTGAAHAEVGVSYATSNGSATAGSDYTATSGALAFADGVTTQTFNVAISEDAADEPDEVLNLTLSSPTGGAALAAPFTATITILDNDAGDTTPPETTILTGPSGLTNDSTPTFTFSANEPSTFQCRVDSVPFAACTSPYTTGALADGPHTFEVRATDLAGNPDATPASRSFTVDTVAPQTTIDSGPTGPTNDSTPTFGFSSEAGATFQCRVDGAAFVSCSSPYTTAALADGAHTFEVRAIDAAGNVDGSPASRAFTVDTAAPQTTIDSGPSGPTNDATATFSFSSEAAATFECRVDSTPFAACSSPYTTVALADGAHTFEVRAIDAVGNVDLSPATRFFTVDTAPPQTTIDSGPSGPTNDSTPTFAFSASEPANFQCRMDGATFAACTSPHTTAALAAGAHTFEVRATDSAGNVGSPASRSFSVDTTAPQTTIDSGPSDPTPTNDSTPTFTFSANEAGTFECRVDDAAFAACTSPHTTVALADGSHSFQVRAIDQAGNVDASPATRAFTVDTGVPVTTILIGPSGLTNDSTPTFTFTADEPSTFECRVDAAAFASCTSPYTTAQLTEGDHTFQVRATDTLGGTGAPVSRAFTIHTGVPVTTIVSGPAPLSNDPTPTFAFAADEPASFHCSIDGAALGPCSSPYTTPPLGDGAHVFEVRATDVAGNAGSAQTGPFTVHTGIPVTTIVSGPTSSTTDTTPTFTFGADEPASFQCRLDGAAFAPCSSPYTTPVLALGAHSFEVRAIDGVGNVDDSPAARAFTVAKVARATVAITSRAVTVTRTRIAAVKLRCGTATRCTGTLALYRRTLKLGSKAFSIPAGRTATVNVRLTARGYKLLVRSRRLSATARLTYRQPDGSTTRASKAITLVAPRRR